MKITKGMAEDAIERFSLGLQNRMLAGRWLSLWQGDELPQFEHFNVAGLSELVPNLLTIEVLPDRQVTVRKAGADICKIMGADLTDMDWVTPAPVRNRNLRMRNLSTIARGAGMKGCRRIAMIDGSFRFNEELVLPFAPRLDGTYPVIAHADWRMDHHLRFTAIKDLPNLAEDRILTFHKKPFGRSAD